MAPNMHHSLFTIQHFMCNYTHNSKRTGHIRILYILNNCSTTGDFYFIGYRCMQGLIGEYGSKHISESLSGKPFVGTYRTYLKKVYVIHGCSAF